MKRSKKQLLAVAVSITTAFALTACASGSTGGGSTTPPSGGGDASEVLTGRGVDVATKTINVAGLQDLSGPGRVIGIPAVGTIQSSIDELNNSGILGEWKINYIVKDHGYNPSESVRLYDEVSPDVLAILPSFGAPATMPLLDKIAQDDMLTFVYSGSSATSSPYTAFGATPYKYEAMRAVDHAVETGGKNVKLAILHQNDDAGEDGLAGFRAAAQGLGAEIVAEVPFDSTAEDFSAPIRLVRDAGATHIIVTSGPGQTAKLLGAAASIGYDPTWYGNWATFIELAFAALPDEAWMNNFYWVHGLPYWGEDRPGVAELMASYEASDVAKDFPAPQGWSVLAHTQVTLLGEVLRTALENGDITPAGVMAAAAKVQDFDAGGFLLTPVDLLDASSLRSARVLKSTGSVGEWEVIGELKEMNF